MSARWHTITPDVREVFTSGATYDGPAITITRQLSRDLWVGVKTVLLKLGAEFVRGGSTFEFESDQDARTIVMHACADGRVMSDAQSAGYVATPAALAEEIVSWYGELRAPLDRSRVLRVLEPSAGRGALLDAITRGGSDQSDWMHVTAIEPDERRARCLPNNAGVTTHVTTFEAFAALCPDETFDVIIGNPPFATPGHATLWADHLLLAWAKLARGGRLVFIVPAIAGHPHAASTARGKAAEVAALIAEHGTREELDIDAFAESGVRVATCVITLDKPITWTTVDVPAGVKPWTFRPWTGTEHIVTVNRPYLTRGAAKYMPVQGIWDWDRENLRVFRYVADCYGCGRPVWDADDGDNDPRGLLGDASAGFSINAPGWDMTGPDVALCIPCGDTGKTYDKARDAAVTAGVWTRAAAGPAEGEPLLTEADRLRVEMERIPATVGAAEFAPYLAQVTGCACDFCVDVQQVRPGDVDGQETMRAARTLLAALRLDVHLHISHEERHASSGRDLAIRLALARVGDVDAATRTRIDGGDLTVSLSDFYITGMGLGIATDTRPQCVTSDVDGLKPGVKVAGVLDAAGQPVNLFTGAPLVDGARSHVYLRRYPHGTGWRLVFAEGFQATVTAGDLFAVEAWSGRWWCGWGSEGQCVGGPQVIEYRFGDQAPEVGHACRLHLSSAVENLTAVGFTATVPTPVHMVHLNAPLCLAFGQHPMSAPVRTEPRTGDVYAVTCPACLQLWGSDALSQDQASDVPAETAAAAKIWTQLLLA